MSRILYHLHIDAAYLPPSFEAWAILNSGFYEDDFPHELKVENQNYPARHLTMQVSIPIRPQGVKEQWQKLKKQALDEKMKGLIQCEYIIEEKKYSGTSQIKHTLLSPLMIKSRKLKGIPGEFFKKHELHLELNKNQTAKSVMSALKGCGFQELESDTSLTFTCSGHPRNLRTIYRTLVKFLEEHSNSITGTMTYEATAFWELLGVDSQDLPPIVDSVLVLQ